MRMNTALNVSSKKHYKKVQLDLRSPKGRGNNLPMSPPNLFKRGRNGLLDPLATCQGQ